MKRRLLQHPLEDEEEDVVRFELQETTTSSNNTRTISASSTVAAAAGVNRSRFHSRRVTRASAQPPPAAADLHEAMAATQERLRGGVDSLLFLAQHPQAMSSLSAAPPQPPPAAAAATSLPSSSSSSLSDGAAAAAHSLVSSNRPSVDHRPHTDSVPSQVDSDGYDDDDKRFDLSDDDENGRPQRNNIAAAGADDEKSSIKAFLADRPSHWGGGQQRKSLPVAAGAANKKSSGTGGAATKRRSSAPAAGGAGKAATKPGMLVHHPPVKVPSKLDAISFKPSWLGASTTSSYSSRAPGAGTRRSMPMDDIQEDDGEEDDTQVDGNMGGGRGRPSPVIARYGGGATANANANGSGGWQSPPSSTKAGKGGKRGAKAKAGSLKAQFFKLSRRVEEKVTRMSNIKKSLTDPQDPRNRSDVWVDVAVLADEGEKWPFRVAVLCVLRVDDRRKGQKGRDDTGAEEHGHDVSRNGSSSSSRSATRGVVLFGDSECGGETADGHGHGHGSSTGDGDGNGDGNDDFAGPGGERSDQAQPGPLHTRSATLATPTSWTEGALVRVYFKQSSYKELERGSRVRIYDPALLSPGAFMGGGGAVRVPVAEGGLEGYAEGGYGGDGGGVGGGDGDGNGGDADGGGGVVAAAIRMLQCLDGRTSELLPKLICTQLSEQC